MTDRNRLRRTISAVLTCAVLVLVRPAGAAQTVGLFKNTESGEGGYTLVRSMVSPSAYLIDEFGREVHSWDDTTYDYWGAPYLRTNGNLVRMVNPVLPATAHIAEFTWDGIKSWDWSWYDTTMTQHHDIEPLPNGNVLILGRHKLSKSAIAELGRDTTGIASDPVLGEQIIEVKRTGPTSGTVVWRWSAFDHLIQDFDSTKLNYGVVEDHPELADINYGPPDANWLHGNSVEYFEPYDQIIFNSRNLNEFWVIDHATTTAEAAGHSGGLRGHGGDILYRWGNPATYRAADSADKQFSWQHHAHIIPLDYPGGGNFIAFNNGNDWQISSIFEIASPADASGNYPTTSPGLPYAPATPVWSYYTNPPESFYAYFISGCQRLRNGNTLIAHGPEGHIWEVDPAGNTVWDYQNPIGRFGATVQGAMPAGASVFRAYRYAKDYPAFEGRDLTPKAALEIYPITIFNTRHSPISPSATEEISIYTKLNSIIPISSATLFADSGTGFFTTQLLDDGNGSDSIAGDGLYSGTIGKVSAESKIEYYVRVVDDTLGVTTDPANPPETLYRITVGYTCGNVDGVVVAGNAVDISDLTYLVDYLFASGPPPVDLGAANMDGLTSGGLPVDISDLTYLVDYLFGGGPGPICGGA